MLDKYQFKILKYIDSTCKKINLNIYSISSKFENKNGITRKDIVEIINFLKFQNYINYVGNNHNIVRTHKGRMYIKMHKFDSFKIFIKDYIYPILVTVIGCIITYFLK